MHATLLNICARTQPGRINNNVKKRRTESCYIVRIKKPRRREMAAKMEDQ